MADTCKECSSKSSDSISSDNFSIYMESSSSEKICKTKKNLVHLFHQQKSLKHAGRNRVHLSNSLQSVKRTKQASNNVSNEQMEESTSWIFSTQEASKGEGHICLKILELPRGRSTKERECFTKHLTCELQKANFQVWIVGFCREFSVLVSKTRKLPFLWLG